MRFKCFSLLFVLVPILATAQTSSNLAEGYDYLATQCKDLQCVSDNLELIDQQIGALVAKRLAYVKRGADLKNHNVLAPKEAGAGYGNSVQRATSQAAEMGASKGAVGSVFESIQKQSNEYEQKYLKSPKKTENANTNTETNAGTNTETSTETNTQPQAQPQQ